MEIGGSGIHHPTGAELQLDTGAADWIAERLLSSERGVGTRVCAVVPTGYQIYVRIFHQAEEYTHGKWVRRHWSEIAQSAGRRMHPSVQFERLGSSCERRIGTLIREEAGSVVGILRQHSATADVCWLAIWAGWAWFTGGAAIGRLHAGGRKRSNQNLEPPSDLRDALRSSLPGREYYIYRGSIEVVPRFEFMPNSLQTPNMWWPADRAWFVGTEIDFDSTIVACSRACADALLASDLEVLEISTEARLDVHGDRLNTPM